MKPQCQCTLETATQVSSQLVLMPHALTHQTCLCVLQLYVPELDRIVLKDSTSQRPFASTSTCRKAVFTTRVLGLVHELCMKQIHVTKRDLFYTDVKLFEVYSYYLICTLHTACLLPVRDMILSRLYNSERQPQSAGSREF